MSYPEIAKKRKSSILVKMFAVVPAPQQILKVSNILPRFVGMDEPSKADTLYWGYYGKTTCSAVAAQAEAVAREKHHRVMTISAWVQIPGYGERAGKPRYIKDNAGYLNLGVLSADLRQELYEEFYRIARERHPVIQASLDWHELILQYPEVIRTFVETNGELVAVTHPVLSVDHGLQNEPMLITSFKRALLTHVQATVEGFPNVDLIW